MSSAGELLVDEERELTTPAILEEGIHEVEFKNKRTNVVRLLPNGFQERKLRRLADTSAKLFNELNYERRQQFFQEKEVDFRGTRNKYYEKYKRTLKVNADQVINKNNEDWSSFFSLLKLKKKGGLPPHTKRVGVPGYWKDEAGKRKPLLIIRQDRYEVDEQNHRLTLKDFNMELEFAGKPGWGGNKAGWKFTTTKRGTPGTLRSQ